MGRTQYFLRYFGTEVLENVPNMGTKTVETFWIVKAYHNDIVLTLKENNSTFPDVVEEEMMSGMGL